MHAGKQLKFIVKLSIVVFIITFFATLADLILDSYFMRIAAPINFIIGIAIFVNLFQAGNDLEKSVLKEESQEE